MKSLFSFFMAVVVFVGLAGCRNYKKTTEILPPVTLEVKDSIREIVKEKLVYIPDTVFVDVPAQSASNTTYSGTSHLETEYALSDAWLNEDGSLGHTLDNKPGQKPQVVYVPQYYRDSIGEKEVIREVPVPTPYKVEVEKELTFMQKIKINSFWILVLATTILGITAVLSVRKLLHSCS